MKKRVLSAKSVFLRYELLLFACVFLLIMGMLAYTNYSYQKKLLETNQKTLQYYIRNKEEMMENVEHSLSNIVANDYSFQMIAYAADRNQAYSSAYQIKEKFKTLLDSAAILDGFGIYTNKKIEYYSCIYRDGIPWQERDAVKRYMTEKLKQDPKQVIGKWNLQQLESDWYLTAVLGSNGVYCFCIIRAESMAMMEMQEEEGDSYIVLAKDGKLLSHRNLADLCGLLPGKSNEAYVTSHSYYVVSQHMNKADCEVLAISEYKGIMSPQSGVVLFLLLFVIFVLFLILLQRYLNRNIVFPTRVMVETMTAIQQGDSQKRMPVVGAIQEYHIIQEQFNEMIDEITELKSIALERLLESNRVALQYYEIQIRPHFFLNCLKNIFGMSETKDNEKIQEFILVLSNYLRFAFKNHQYVIPVQEELSGIRDYIHLQQMTMENPVQYTEEIEPGLENYLIPPISLLTFVENSIRYLHTEDREPSISIHIRRLEAGQESMVNICIMDNGTGFDEEMLQKLNAGGSGISGDHIGINNVQHRFQLIYGEECIFSYTNRNGACVDLYIPAEREPMQEAEKGSANWKK